MLTVAGNRVDVPGAYDPWLPFALGTAPARQSIKAQNRIGGSRPGPGSAPGASLTATLDCTWGSQDRREDGRRVDGTTSYLLDGMSVIAQYAPDGARQAWYTQSLARIDEVLSVLNGQGKFWYQTDALGSTYALANGAGQVVARGGYDVFGEPVPVSGKAIGQPFGFTGREHELDSGLVYARARYLQPGVGRWSRPDPMGFVDGPHVYGYALGNPARYVDPEGLSIDPVTRFVAGIAAKEVFDAIVQWAEFVLDVNECDPDQQVMASLGGTYLTWLMGLWFVATVVESGGGGGDGGKFKTYKSVKEAPRYPKNFAPVKNGLKKFNVNDRDVLEGLRKVEPGKWKKVYSDGFVDGERVSVHWFESPSGRVFGVKPKPGWSVL